MNSLLLIFILAFILSLFLTRFLIFLLKKYKIGKHIRKEGPTEHYKKEGTPVMGGLIFLVIMIPFLFHKNTFFFALSTILMGLFGLLDDILLLINKDYGIKPLRKIIITLIISIFLYIFAPKNTYIYTNNHSWNLGILYPIFFVLLFTYLPNAINLTDGLDGLAGGISLISLIFLLIFLLIRNDFMNAVATVCLISAILGFLWFNVHPAEIIMGDVGAFSLGSALASLLVLSKTEALFLFVSGIPFLESLSVFIQVAFYKLKKRRIFKMSPLHHHFELSGWKETKVVGRFYILHLLILIGGFILWTYL